MENENKKCNCECKECCAQLGGHVTPPEQREKWEIGLEKELEDWLVPFEPSQLASEELFSFISKLREEARQEGRAEAVKDIFFIGVNNDTGIRKVSFEDIIDYAKKHNISLK